MPPAIKQLFLPLLALAFITAFAIPANAAGYRHQSLALG